MEKFVGLGLMLLSLSVAAQDGTPRDKWLANLRPIMSQGLCKGAGSPFASIYKGTAEQCVPEVESLFDTCATKDPHVVLPAALTSVPQANLYGQVMAECVSAHHQGGEALKAFYLLQDRSSRSGS